MALVANGGMGADEAGWKRDLATRAGTIEDKLANGASAGKVFSEKTTYFFFETPVDRYGNNRQIYEHPVADAELLRLLNQRLAYYLDYRIKDLQDGTVMTFVKAFLMRGKFYMTMSTAEGRVRSYRLDHKDETGRDIYKNCSEVELRQIADFDHHWSAKNILVDGQKVRASFITEIEYNNRYYVTFRYSHDFTQAFEQRLDHMEQNILGAGQADTDELAQRIAKLEDKYSAVLMSLDDKFNEMKSVVDAANAPNDEKINAVASKLISRFDREQESVISATTKRLMDFDNRLQPLPTQLHTIVGRVSNLEDQISALALGVKGYGSRALEQTDYYFYEALVDEKGVNLRMKDEMVSDPAVKTKLKDRLDYYLNYRIKDLQDGEVLSFQKAFYMHGKFFMLMSNNLNKSDSRVYRLDRKDEYGRDVYKNSTVQEKTVVESTATIWDVKREKIQGELVHLPFLTEIEFEGKYYVVFKHTVDVFINFERRLAMCESVVPETRREVQESHSALRERIMSLDARLDELSSLLKRTMDGQMSDFNVLISESEARQTNKLDSVVGSLQDAIDGTDRKYQALPNAMSGHSQRIADLEDEIRRLLSELRRVEAKVAKSDDANYYFYPLNTAGALTTVGHTYVQDTPLVGNLMERLRYYQNYKIKDLADSAVLSFKKAVYLGGNFFMTMSDPNDPMAVRCYRLDSKDEQGRDVFKNATESERKMIFQNEQDFEDRQVVIAGSKQHLGYSTIIELDNLYYGVFKSENLSSRVESLQKEVGALKSAAHDNHDSRVAQDAKLREIEQQLGAIRDLSSAAIEVRLSNLEQSSERVQKKANDVVEEVRRVATDITPLPQQLGAQDKKIAQLLAEMDDLRRMVDGASSGGDQELYFFFHISPTMSGAQVSLSNMVIEDSLLRDLGDRLNFYREYRIKDLSDKRILRFHRAFLVNGKFYMQMSSGDGLLRAYRLDRKEQGRDIFKNALEHERSEIEKHEHEYEPMEIPWKQKTVQATYMTEIEYADRYYAVYQSDTIPNRVKALEQRVLDGGVGNSGEVMRRLEEMKRSMPSSPGGASSFAVEPLQRAHDQLAGKQDMLEMRLMALEKRGPTSSAGPSYRYVKLASKIPGAATNFEVSDPNLLARLNNRVEYFINYKLKDLNDSGIVVFFVRAFYTDGQFYMIMAAPDAQNDPRRHRAYRLEARDPMGRDKFKLVSADEFRRISELEASTVSQQGPAGSDYFTQIELDDEYYSVFRDSATAAASSASGGASSAALASLEQRIQRLEMQGAGAQASGTDELRRRQAELEAQQADLSRMMDSVVRSGPGGAGGGGDMARMMQLEDEVEQLRKENRGYADGTAYYFEITRMGSKQLDNTPIANASLRTQLDSRLLHYRQYRIKDQGDGTVLKYRRSWSMGEDFFLEMHSLDEPSREMRRYYKFEAHDSDGRAKFSITNQQELSSIARELQMYDVRKVRADDLELRLVFHTEIDVNGRFYAVYYPEGSLANRLFQIEDQIYRLTRQVSEGGMSGDGGGGMSRDTAARMQQLEMFLGIGARAVGNYLFFRDQMPVANPDAVADLYERLAALQGYQMKDVKEDVRMVFVRAVSRNGRFYMVMRSTTGKLKIYVKTGSDASGRDQFKNPPVDEQRSIMQESLWSYVRSIKATDQMGNSRDTKAFLVTDMEHKGEMYEVYQVFGLPDSDISSRLQNLEDLMKNVTSLQEAHTLQFGAKLTAIEDSFSQPQ
jgi:Mg2+ and Co2+ transporter CorA